MDKFMEKIGLYDLWVVTLPGAFFTTLLKSVYDFMVEAPVQTTDMGGTIGYLLSFSQINIYAPTTFYDFAIFIFISYLSGIILQEMSGIIKEKILYKHGKPDNLILDKDGGVLSESQIQHYMPMFIELNNNLPFTINDNKKLKLESHDVFRKINAILQQKNIAKKYVKLNILYNMSLNLFVASVILLSICFAFEFQYLVNTQYNAIISTLSVVLIFLISCYVFLKRSKKYNIYWIRNLILAYYIQRTNVDSEQHAVT